MHHDKNVTSSFKSNVKQGVYSWLILFFFFQHGKNENLSYPVEGASDS